MATDANKMTADCSVCRHFICVILFNKEFEEPQGDFIAQSDFNVVCGYKTIRNLSIRLQKVNIRPESVDILGMYKNIPATIDNRPCYRDKLFKEVVNQ